MAHLSRNDIERIAKVVLNQYKVMFVPTQHICYTVDVTQLARMLGFRIEYVHITADGSILGQTSSGAVWTTIYDDNMNRMYFELDGSTILVEKRLLNDPRLEGM